MSERPSAADEAHCVPLEGVKPATDIHDPTQGCRVGFLWIRQCFNYSWIQALFVPKDDRSKTRKASQRGLMEEELGMRVGVDKHIRQTRLSVRPLKDENSTAQKKTFPQTELFPA